MFIELTNENGNFVLINTNAIRSVFADDKDLDKAVVCYTGDVTKYLNVTESYAEVVTMIRNATDVQKVECVNKDKGVFKLVNFDNEGNPIDSNEQSDEENYVDPFDEEDTNELN